MHPLKCALKKKKRNMSSYVTSLGYRCQRVCIVIGSLGTVYRHVVSGLKLIECPWYMTTWLAQYLGGLQSTLALLQTWDPFKYGRDVAANFVHEVTLPLNHSQTLDSLQWFACCNSCKSLMLFAKPWDTAHFI